MYLVIGSIIAAVVVIVQVLGVIAAIKAVLATRTPQGSIAWGLALLSFPIVSLPLFLVFGRTKFRGNVNARRAGSRVLDDLKEQVPSNVSDYISDLELRFANARVLTQLAHLPFLRGNQAELLIDGEATFDAMFRAIDQARDYVLAEFYIVKDDELGRKFKDHLIAAAKRGCDVYLLFDDVGSSGMSNAYLNELREANVRTSAMKPNQGWFNRFQINFRNHRKIVVVDGEVALVGGLNVGDEYVHKSKRLTPWRDTHMKLVGPATIAVQIAFVEDWLWATREIPNICWDATPADDDDQIMFVFPSGPDDDLETCGLFFTHAINAATERLWIASPYFVPDEGIVTALQLAAMRGVDVRILIPGMADKWLVKQAAMAYVPEVASAGVKMYEYQEGFMHQKVAIVDDMISMVGTANLDNRSFRLNFEILVVTIDDAFNNEVASMLETDFANSSLLEPDELAQRGLFHKVSSRVARLFAPIL